jgi:hypothetical protein
MLFFRHFPAFRGLPASSAWNNFLDIIVKNSLLLIMVEALAFSVERVWAVQMTTLFCTFWWVKGGLRLSAMGATYSGRPADGRRGLHDREPERVRLHDVRVSAAVSVRLSSRPRRNGSNGFFWPAPWPTSTSFSRRAAAPGW